MTRALAAMVLLWAVACKNPVVQAVCLGKNTEETQACVTIGDWSSGVSCSVSAYALEKMDEKLAKDENDRAAARTLASLKVLDAGADAGSVDAGAAAGWPDGGARDAGRT